MKQIGKCNKKKQQQQQQPHSNINKKKKERKKNYILYINAHIFSFKFEILIIYALILLTNDDRNNEIKEN